MANLNKVQRLTFIRDAGQDKNFNYLGVYRCECGSEKVYAKKNVRNMRSTACGCQRYGEANKWGLKHGLRKHYLYHTWDLMRDRCNKEYCPDYKNYGGRGIKVCDEWNNNMSTFIQWAEANGFQKGLQLDRINNNGNYEPGNCRFITQKENCNNKRNNRFLELNGRKQTVQQWADEIGISSGTLRRRIDVYKMPLEKALQKVVA